MAKPRQGGPLTIQHVEDAIRKQLANLGAGNFQARALGVGTPGHGNLAGVHNAQWAFVKLTNPGGEIEVPHSLGVVPVTVELVDLDVPRGVSPVPHAHATPVRLSEWTSTTARVDIVALAGSLDRCTARFLVKGP